MMMVFMLLLVFGLMHVTMFIVTRYMVNYAAFAAESPGEFEALINEILVPETWFFRDREPFRFLARFCWVFVLLAAAFELSGFA